MISVRLVAILLEPSGADAAEIVRTKRPMAVRPDRQCHGGDRYPDELSHSHTSSAALRASPDIPESRVWPRRWPVRGRLRQRKRSPHVNRRRCRRCVEDRWLGGGVFSQKDGRRGKPAAQEQKYGRCRPRRRRQDDDERAREQPDGNDCCARDEDSHVCTLHPARECGCIEANRPTIQCQAGLTFSPRGPLGPCPRSNVTACPS
jgi:hypothetical protein